MDTKHNLSCPASWRAYAFELQVIVGIWYIHDSGAPDTRCFFRHAVLLSMYWSITIIHPFETKQSPWGDCCSGAGMTHAYRILLVSKYYVLFA